MTWYHKASNIASYNREKAVEYAHKWAYTRNSSYLDFEKLGGDCTNFASQVIFAGSGVMNFTPVHGWYYINSRKRTASWTGVNFLHNFLINNRGAGPFGEVVDVKDVEPGDIAQLSFNSDGMFNHTPIIVKAGTPPALDNLLIAAHTYDRDNYEITNYNWVHIRFIHIIGVRASG
ncbi:MAG: amidase domain-containing protein [Clostridia bacterium]|nr:amidase domain-containing protein [Clostridia bacterium]